MHPRFRHLKRVTPSLYCRLAVETDGTFWSDVFKYFLFSGWSTKCTCANIDKMLGDNFILKNIPVTRNVWLVTALLFFIHSKKRRSSSSCLSSGPTTLWFSNCLPLKKKSFHLLHKQKSATENIDPESPANHQHQSWDVVVFQEEWVDVCLA